MSASKKRLISGLTDLEAELSLAQLRKLRSTMISEDVLDSATTSPDTFRDSLDRAIVLLESRPKDSLSLSFAAVDESDLERLNIKHVGMLLLQSPEKSRDAIESTRELGAAELWSNGNMYKHLAFLSNTYSKVNGTSSRMFIDTFFFRTAAMLPSDQRVVVMRGKPVPSARPGESKTDTVSGVIDYTALVMDADSARVYRSMPFRLASNVARNFAAFFTAEAKASHGTTLQEHIPPALVELVACAKYLGKTHVRGAVTTGDQWVFLALDLDSAGEGATYWQSEEVEWAWRIEEGALDATVPATSDRYDPAVIAGILSSWVPNGFSEFNGDKWFYKFPMT